MVTELKHRVIQVINGDSFIVSPPWEFKKKKGLRVQCTGYNKPERHNPGYQEAKKKLKEIVLNKEINLKPIRLSQGRLLCAVYIDGKNVADFFPEYQ